jgi:hydrogen peroxide-dependent heme synthase
MKTEPVYVSYSSWSGLSQADQSEVESLAGSAHDLFKSWKDRITVRGFYSTAGFQGADLVMWWIATSAEDVQGLTADFFKSPLGRELYQGRSFLGVHRPPETAPDHVPAFMRGEPPRRYLCVYPFVRTPEWYLLPKQERADLLAEHGVMGREFPRVLPNTTSAFGLGDYEWILAFEADDLVELVDCIRRLRDSRSRLYVKAETPFITGIRKDLVEVIGDVLV